MKRFNSVKVIVGGQFGSEGKGKVAKYLSNDCDCMIRCGGSNSGHTIYHNHNKYVLRHLPAGVVNPNCHLLIPAGSNININVLLQEVKRFKVSSDRLSIDPNTFVITDQDIIYENNINLNSSIGSTLSGTGGCTIRRIDRKYNITAKDYDILKPYIRNTYDVLDSCRNIVVEGTQGFGLSLYHSPYYPFTTSRDTTASGVCSEAGISPMSVTEIILVIRALPIRVSGNSGPLPNELTWDSLDIEPEYTSVTNKIRRIGLFDSDIVNRAIQYNNPTSIVLNHVDYIESYKDIEKLLNKKINYIGNGPDNIIKI